MGIAIGGYFYSDNKEIFPFFRWSLYSKTPNTLQLPYVVVTRIGDEVLDKPTDLRLLKDVHHIKPVTTDLNVNKFYQSFLDKRLSHNNSLDNMLPEGSAFVLCLKTIDLSKTEYKKGIKIDTLAYFDNKISRPLE